LSWLGQVIWYRRTGLAQVPRSRPTRSAVAGMFVLITWLVAAIALGRSLPLRLWRGGPSVLEAACLAHVVALAAVFAFLVRRGNAVRERLRQVQMAYSVPEIVLRALGIAWVVVGWFTVGVLAPGSLSWGWGLKPWFPIPAAVVILFLGQLALLGATAAATHRR
jgi:hypothetical protein